MHPQLSANCPGAATIQASWFTMDKLGKSDFVHGGSWGQIYSLKLLRLNETAKAEQQKT
jgi:hypothetical protein